MNKFKKSLWAKVFALILVATIIPLLVYSTYVSITFRDNSVKLHQTFAQTLANSKKATIDNFFLSKENLLNAYSEDFDMLKSNNYKELQDLLKSLNRADTSFMSSYIGFPDKKFIIEPNEQMPDGYDCTSRSWYQKAMQNPGQVVITDSYMNISENNKELIITIARQVTFLDGTSAVVGVDASLTTLSKILTQDKIDENVYTYIISQQGQILAHKNEQLVGQDISKENFIQEMIKNKDGVIGYKFNGKSLIGGYATSKHGFIVGVAIPSSDYLELVNSFRIVNSLLVLFLILLIVSVLSIFIRKVVLDKLLHAVNIANDLANGDYTVRLDVNSEDEIGDLQKAINNMISSHKLIITKLGETKNILLDSSDNISKITNELGSASTEVANTMQQVAQGHLNKQQI